MKSVNAIGFLQHFWISTLDVLLHDLEGAWFIAFKTMNGRREGSDKLPNDFPSLTNETTGCAITRAGVFDPGGTRIYEFTEAERQRVEIARRRKNTAVQYSRLHAAQYFRITAHCANYDISRGIEGPSP